VRFANCWRISLFDRNKHLALEKKDLFLDASVTALGEVMFIFFSLERVKAEHP
jgi:hypothetical protein